MAKPIRLSNPDCPKFTIGKTHTKAILNYASLSDNSNKFFIAELQEGNGDYTFRIYTEYGRMGKPNPAREGRHYHSLREAQSEYESLLHEKRTKKQYKDVVVDDHNTPSSTQVVNVKTKKEDLSQVTDKVLRLIGKLYQSATSYVVKSIETPLGKLSATQVAKGLEILQRLEDLLDRGVQNVNDFERFTNEFYSIIPFVFGNKVDYGRFMINDYTKLNERKDLLGVMSSIVQAQSTLEKTLEEKYKSLNIKLKNLSTRTNEYKRLEEFVQKTKGHNHHFGFEIKEIFEVEDMVNNNKFNPYKVSTMELFHGSRNENILSIMQSGLKIKPKSAVHSGSMFGSGIYLADQSTKSANYCWGFDSQHTSRGKEYYLFVCEVATGKVKEYNSQQPHLSSAPMGFNSVKGVKGPSLVHNEYIVYKDSQVKIKYIIEFKKV